MDKMKKYFIYIILLILLAVISEFLIAVGLNSTYKQIENSSSSIPNISILQAEATKVNGRIRGMIKNEENPIEGKYLKIDFFSDRDVNMGSKYIEIDKTVEDQPFELFFKLNNVTNYKMSVVNEKEPVKEIEIIPKDLTKREIIMATVIAMIVFWG